MYFLMDEANSVKITVYHTIVNGCMKITNIKLGHGTSVSSSTLQNMHKPCLPIAPRLTEQLSKLGYHCFTCLFFDSNKLRTLIGLL